MIKNTKPTTKKAVGFVKNYDISRFDNFLKVVKSKNSLRFLQNLFYFLHIKVPLSEGFREDYQIFTRSSVLRKSFALLSILKAS